MASELDRLIDGGYLAEPVFWESNELTGWLVPGSVAAARGDGLLRRK